MSKHTPGPWRVGISGNPRVYGPDGDPETAGPVAEACHRHDPAVRAANARLIAAAPETAAERDRYRKALLEISMTVDDRTGKFSLAYNQAQIAKRALTISEKEPQTDG